MYNSLKYIVKEYMSNIYRIFLIARYEVISDYRDSNLGILWSIINPLIQLGTYWFVFGFGIRSGKPVDGIEFFPWMVAGMIAWFFMSDCIRKTTTSISSKISILQKMKFPVSILPATVVVSQIFNHLVMIVIGMIIFTIQGYKPSIYNFRFLYYFFCSIAFLTSFGLVFSVLNMIAGDVKRGVNASMRMLMYITPILWTMENLPLPIQNIMKINPIYYIVEGYRKSFLYGSLGTIDVQSTIVFWTITIFLFLIGSNLMYKYRHKFIDLS